MGPLLEPSHKRGFVRERPVAHVGPQRVMLAERDPQGGAMPAGVELLHPAETSRQRHGVRLAGRGRVDRRGARQRRHHSFRRARSARNIALSSALGGVLAKPSNLPASAISLAARMKPAHAARDNAPPTLMRRAPSSAMSLTVRSLANPTNTFTGFG